MILSNWASANDRSCGREKETNKVVIGWDHSAFCLLIWWGGHGWIPYSKKASESTLLEWHQPETRHCEVGWQFLPCHTSTPAARRVRSHCWVGRKKAKDARGSSKLDPRHNRNTYEPSNFMDAVHTHFERSISQRQGSGLFLGKWNAWHGFPLPSSPNGPW